MIRFAALVHSDGGGQNRSTRNNKSESAAIEITFGYSKCELFLTSCGNLQLNSAT